MDVAGGCIVEESGQVISATVADRGVGRLGDHGKGWKFTKGGAVKKKVLVEAGKQLRIVAKGAGLGHSLAVDPAQVDVVLTLGDRAYCLGFGGPTATWVEGKKFLVKDTAALAACVP
jgi:hypothetical protein